ncbi:MAG: N-acetylmuramoyl-L-alanine amidase [Gemmatimonadota bacterium]
MPITANWIGSPSKTSGRSGHRPEAIVIHIMEGTLAGTDSWFKSPQSKVSAHYGVGQNGEIHQYVAEGDTAFHAGRTFNCTWKGRRAGVNPNSNTIGIEHEGQANSDWSTKMYEASAALIAEIANRWSIPLDRDHIVGHREIYGHKTCPGAKVDLDHLIERARQHAMQSGAYNFHPAQGQVKAKSDLNVRKGAPTTAAPVKRTVPSGSSLPYVGWTSNGLSVNGNSHWYRDGNGDYFWAGATTNPTPGLQPEPRGGH